MNKKLIVSWGIALLSIGAFGQSTAEGYVYEDINNNGKKEKKEKGVQGVAVSNGMDVVLTDANGKYSLPVGDDNIIFVIKPSGYQTAMNEFNLPKAHYNHKANGSPESKYKGIDPTGKLPKSIDFALYKYEEPQEFTSFIFGDPQVYTEEEVGYLTKGIVTETQNNAAGIAFGISLGDLVGDNLSLHPLYLNAMKNIGIPWYNVMGNHDMNYDTKEDRLSDETYELNFGPNNYSFNYGQAHFIVLDDIIYPHPTKGKGYLGGLRGDQLQFVENDLKYTPKDRLIVISMHIPLLDRENPGAFRDTDRQKLYELLNEYPNVLFLSAHTHFQYHNFIGKEDGLNRAKPIHEYNVGTTSGDWYSGVLNEAGLPTSTMRDGTPQGYAFLKVTGNKYSLNYKAFNKPADYQISIYNPKVVAYNKNTSASIYANFFMGAENDVVEYRIDNGKWTKMKKVEEFDPTYCRYVQDWDYLEDVVPVRRPSNPAICRHLWKVKIPTKLPQGEHIIEVRAQDMFGKTHTQKSSYKIL